MQPVNRNVNSYNASKEILKDKLAGPQDDQIGAKPHQEELSYQKRKKPIQMLSPERKDPFAAPQKVESQNNKRMQRGYRDIMAEQSLENERQSSLGQTQGRPLYGTGTGVSIVKNEEYSQESDDKSTSSKTSTQSVRTGAGSTKVTASIAGSSLTPAVASGSNKWAATPGQTPLAKKNRWDLTPVGSSVGVKRTAAGLTPTPRGWGMETPMRGTSIGETPSREGKSRWDQTPVAKDGTAFGPGAAASQSLMTPTTQQMLSQMTPQQIQQWRIEKEMEERNKPLTDDEIDRILPRDGYEVSLQAGRQILAPPQDYKPIRTPARKLLATPTPLAATPLYFQLPGSNMDESKPYNIPMTPQEASEAMPYMKPEDVNAFGALLNQVDESELSRDQIVERKIMLLLLKVKNGSPPMRKQALRTITEKAREFGAGRLFGQILPLLMSPTLEEQERHLLVKVVDRILYKLDQLVRPYVHKILVVIMPMLIDQDYYARVEGREIISNLAKAAGLSTMIYNMRQDIDHNDEYVRNTTARAFAVVAGALGIPALLPFLKAVCHSKKSAKARHTGIKIVQQIAILMGCAVLPYLKKLVEIIEHGLKDEQQKIRTITALALSALAEASAPYGIQAFESVLIPLWNGTQMYHGKTLAAFLKAIGYIIPLMDPEHASAYTKEVMHILIPAFKNPEEEMKKIVLKVVKQCVGTDGVEAVYVREQVVPPFFKSYWVRRMAHDHRNAKQLCETTLEIATKIGGADVLSRLVEHLKDDSEAFRKLVMEALEKIVATLGVADIDTRLEEQLMDGVIYAFQEQVMDEYQVVINGIGTLVNCMGTRVKRYISQICGTIKWNLKNPSSKVRQNAADLITRVAAVMKTCGEDLIMSQLGVTLYQLLGEEYPEVLGSILGALKAIVNTIGMVRMKPPIKELLPRLTPILKNRHEKVQENCIDLVGRIADRGAEFVSPKEWMRICFDLLDLLRAHKKGIRRATVNTFGYIAKAIGPHDVLATLLNNLRVQERQNRVCTAVAIGIVAETCGPFTVIPALMNEYRVPEMNVQNGVLKSLSFMFEYIGEMAKDYIYAITPLLEDALIDRDLVHRQTAASVIKHLALGVSGLSCEDALAHLLNFVWPNIFETSPHVINAVLEGCEGLRVGLGAPRVMMYVIQGLFHPARRVRTIYWKIYNNMYLAAADAMIPNYPYVPDVPRPELELFI